MFTLSKEVPDKHYADTRIHKCIERDDTRFRTKSKEGLTYAHSLNTPPSKRHILLCNGRI